MEFLQDNYPQNFQDDGDKSLEEEFSDGALRPELKLSQLEENWKEAVKAIKCLSDDLMAKKVFNMYQTEEYQPIWLFKQLKQVV